jgi:carboxyl-terminal processing protease
MRALERLGRVLVVLGVFAIASYFALRFGTGGLWRGLEAAQAVTAPGAPKAPYDLTQLVAVNETLKTISEKYVDPSRVHPRQMFLSALNQVQKEVAQVIVLHDPKAPTVRVKVDTEVRAFRVDNIQGPWDVAARLREVFAFLQKNLKNTEVDLRDVEYAACNGMLSTLDPHSLFMSPDEYKEMNLSTSGQFGGLGIVISIRDQMLTVIRPMPETPAGRAGLKRLDRITKINNESTLNMPLDDAVKRLRGAPGSKVTIWIHRDGADGWSGSRPFELTREEIHVRSVDYRTLAPGIGYIRIKQFQSSTSDELDAALDALHKQGPLRGLVLDLRLNPGGLLDQAAKVADKFLSRGVIVSTVGQSEGREVKRATAPGTEPDYPIAMIVNGESASASEIVTGALKNHDRVVVVGQTTFGKGSVQLVFPHITPDGAALKLTIAQYLTPGDVSIQGVGVTPDIQLDPMTADNLEMDLFRTGHPLRERDLSKSLSYGGKRNTETPYFKLRYDLSERQREKLIELGADVEDEFRLDFPIKFARDLVSRMPSGPRPAELKAVRPFLEKTQQTEIEAISQDLSKMGIDWSAPPADVKTGPTASDYDVKVETDKRDDTVLAGQPMTLKVTVRNKSKFPIYQLRATTKSDGTYYDEKELIFGKIGPGESKTATAPLGFCEVKGHKPGSTKPVPTDAKRVCKLPLEAVTRQDVVKVNFFAKGGDPPKEQEFRPTVKALPRPIFAYDYQIADNRPGNGDGQLARGEGSTIYLTVKNVGKGRSYDTQADLRNLTGDGILLRAGRFDLSNMMPGDVRHVAFTFDVLKALPENLIKLDLSVVDRDLRVLANEKLTIPITQNGLYINSASGRVDAVKASAVRGQPVASAHVVGSLEKGAIVQRLGTFGNYTKVSLGGDRFGFVDSQDLHDSKAPLAVHFQPLLSRSPPLLEVQPAALATRSSHIRVQGVATDNDRVVDGYIFVGSHKVFYKSNRKSSDPRRMPFSFDADLEPGINVITVVARENEDTATSRTLVVRRDGPNGEALPTPKTELFGEDWQFGSKH